MGVSRFGEKGRPELTIFHCHGYVLEVDFYSVTRKLVHQKAVGTCRLLPQETSTTGIIIRTGHQAFPSEDRGAEERTSTG